MASEPYTLPRSGKAPIYFRGELVSGSEGRRQAGKDHTRWHDVEIYRTSNGCYIAWVSYGTAWKGEVGHDCTFHGSGDEIVQALSSYDPLAHVGGYPPGDQFAEKQRRLLEDVKARWQAQVSEVLNYEEFAEVVK